MGETGKPERITLRSDLAHLGVFAKEYRKDLRSVARFRYKLRKFLLNKILHADDTPHAIALGVGLSVLIAFLPLVGLQTAIAVGLAALLRANKAVCFPIVWITNPATMWFIYGGCWKLGHWIVSSAPPHGVPAPLAQLEQSPTTPFYDVAFWEEKFKILMDLGKELWIGCLIVGAVLGIISYVITHRGVIGYRERRRQRILRRNMFRAKLQHSKISQRGTSS